MGKPVTARAKSASFVILSLEIRMMVPGVDQNAENTMGLRGICSISWFVIRRRHCKLFPGNRCPMRKL